MDILDKTNKYYPINQFININNNILNNSNTFK